MSESVQIRRARTGDIDAIVELWIEMMQEHEQFEKNVHLSPTAAQDYNQYASYHILNNDSILMVAEDNKEIIGYCLAYKTKNLPMFSPEYYGYLSDIAVRPGSQHRGIGASILRRVVDWFRQQGVRNMQLQVYEKNEIGTKFWDQQNFKRYVRGLWFDL